MYNERGGYCYCGCGQKTLPCKRTSKLRNFSIGEPARFINRHHCVGSNHHNWRGGTGLNERGYKWVSIGKKRQKQIHRIIAEKVYGKPLPSTARVHHFDRDPSNNSHGNLVICENSAYHAFIHRRTTAFISCGHVDWLKCVICKQWSPPHEIYRHGSQSYHTECKVEYNRALLRDRRAA